MVNLTQEILSELKKPLGKIFVNIEEMLKETKGKKIISIGDISTINLIKCGVTPHVAVFDFKSQRKELENDLKKILENVYPNPKQYKNEAGTISDQLIKDAPKLLKEGGGVLVIGEEDICALAFIMSTKNQYSIIYGQPKEGIVLVKASEQLKRKIKKWILSSRALSHKV
ncbi:MAG: DUF359 domain-containing protein [Candidatus Bilamarchaeum sp.]|jgi:uncharacterized protein (UPF0218 family)